MRDETPRGVEILFISHIVYPLLYYRRSMSSRYTKFCRLEYLNPDQTEFFF